jgi:hypothetical protein
MRSNSSPEAPRVLRRGKTTVSKASRRMMNMRTIPAIDAHQCIRNEIQMTREWYQIQKANKREVSHVTVCSPINR